MPNRIHSSALIGPGVTLGNNNVVGPGAVIVGPTTIGDDNWIGPGAIIGTPAEMRGGPHPAAWDEDPETTEPGVIIGDRNVLRELAVVQQPTPGGITRIGNDGYFMEKTHIPHDASLGDRVTLAPMVVLAGFVEVGDGANLGLSVVVHQRVRIGTLAMLGMGAVVSRDVPPFALAYGAPARVHRINEVGMTRAGFGANAVATAAYRLTSAAAPPVLDETVQSLLDDWNANG